MITPTVLVPQPNNIDKKSDKFQPLGTLGVPEFRSSGFSTHVPSFEFRSSGVPEFAKKNFLSTYGVEPSVPVQQKKGPYYSAVSDGGNSQGRKKNGQRPYADFSDFRISGSISDFRISGFPDFQFLCYDK